MISMTLRLVFSPWRGVTISSMSISRVEILARARTISISSGKKKYQGSNSGDGGNTGDGGKTVGGAIGARGGGIGYSSLVELYACMTFIYGSSWKGEMASEAKRSLDKSSEGSEEMFPGEAGNSTVNPGYSLEYL
ncbi:hypothetical protein Tco_0409174 [Tanacetum coccineum]